MISILPIQPDILQMMAEDTGLTAEGPVWGYFAAEGTKMLGYVVVEKAEPGAHHSAAMRGLCDCRWAAAPGAASLLRGGQQGLYLCVRSAHAAADGLYPPGSGQPGGPFCGEMPRKYRRNLKKPLAFFRWECYHNKVPSNSM